MSALNTGYCDGSATYLGPEYLGSAQNGQVARTAYGDATSGEWAMATFDAVISAGNAIIRLASSAGGIPSGPSAVKAGVLASAGGNSRAVDLSGATGPGAAGRLSFTKAGQLESAAIPVDRFAGGLSAVRAWPSPPSAAASSPACAPTG